MKTKAKIDTKLLERKESLVPTSWQKDAESVHVLRQRQARSVLQARKPK